MATSWENEIKHGSGGGDSFLLQENGDYLLLETGDKIILTEGTGDTVWTYQQKN